MGTKIQRFLHSTAFSLLVLIILVTGLGIVAYNVTLSYKEEPDFGGMVTIRQANMGGQPYNTLQLSRDMLLDHITTRDVLMPIAQKYGWHVPYETMFKNIEVRERLATQSSFIIVVNSQNPARSLQIVRALTLSFLNDYRKKWEAKSKVYLKKGAEQIAFYSKELEDLKKLKKRFDDQKELRPLNTEIEMKALNDQLVEAQNQFMSAYGAYISNLEQKRSAMQLEFDLASQLYTPDDKRIRNLKLQLAELDRQCVATRTQFAKQKPDLYRMTTEPQKLTGLPNDILYLYDNIQSLQQIKLSLIVDSLIEGKEKMLEDELKRKNTIERLLDSQSCDVFIREVR